MRIDTSTISGFDDMTPEEKVKALLGFEYDNGAENAKRLKDAVDKATSEAASYKKQLKEKMTAEELAKQETEGTLKALQDKLAEYEQREKVSEAKSMFLAGGFDEATASAAADAFVSGDSAKMSKALKTYRTAIETDTKSKLMDANPTPDGANQAAQNAGGVSGASEADAAAQIFADLHAAQYGAAPTN